MHPNMNPLLKRFAGKIFRTLCCALLAGGVPLMAFANQDDPINIEADRAVISEKQGVSTYSGNVVLTQGGIKINADKVIVHHDGGKLTHVTATGTPVKYYQQGKTPELDIRGEANTMEYFAIEERLLLLDSAKLTQSGNAFSGNRIDYDTQREVVSAAVSATGEERVQVTIQPKTLSAPKTKTDQDPPSDNAE